VVPGRMFPVLYKLRGHGVFRDLAHAKTASRPSSDFVDGAPRLAGRVRQVDRVESFLPSLMLLLF